MPMLLAVGK